MTAKSNSEAELRALIHEAFSLAAKEGRPDWFRMHGSVLKNRLLDLTNRSFDESIYGAEGFAELMEQLRDLLAIDHTVRPFVVELLESERSQIETPSAAGGALTGRIRSDLWDAIVDYSNANAWVWDEATGQAVPVEEGVDVGLDNLLPTVDPQILQAWRTDFADEHSDQLSAEERSQVNEWADKGLGTVALPVRLRRSWNNRLRDEVHTKIVGYFKSKKIEPPPDLLTERRVKRSSDELRSFVMRCVSLMDETELKDLSIPADVAMRASR